MNDDLNFAWKPCLHPQNEYDPSNTVDALPSLANFSADVLVLYPDLLESSLEYMPKHMLALLLSAAIKANSYKSMQILISNWPERVLSLKDIIGATSMGRQNLSDPFVYANYMVAAGSHYTTSLVQIFVDCLRERKPSQLRVLDLRGFPTVDLTIQYLATHIILAYNEVKQNQIVEIVQQFRDEGRIPTSEMDRFGDLDPIRTTLPKGAYGVVVDAVLKESESFAEFCKALKICSFGQVMFHMIVNSIEMVKYCESQISILLELLPKEHLKGIALAGKENWNLGWAVTTPLLISFNEITSLDISNNSLDFCGNVDLSELTGMTFQALRNLKRLDLSYNYVGPRLRRLLTHSTHGIEYINLESTGMTEIDLIFLSNSCHSRTLKAVNLSKNRVSTYMLTLISFIHSLQKTLTSLELRDSRFRDCHLDQLVRNVIPQCDLSFFDLSHNDFSGPTLLTSLFERVRRWPAGSGVPDAATHHNFQSLPVPTRNARMLRISYPLSCYEVQESVEYESKFSFTSRVKAFMAQNVPESSSEFPVNNASPLPSPSRKINIIWTNIFPELTLARNEN